MHRPCSAAINHASTGWPIDEPGLDHELKRKDEVSMKIRRRPIVPAVTIALACTGAAMAQLPDPGMEIDPENTALVVTDPQNDFLSPKEAN